ncbi:hypothetical protein MTR67_050928 [Solanum verrucosum]|uniref:Uncharacterized protein n=1 Tax=Solanum verrucosum TaxID=315347 RepID=A0AAF1A1N3_SOLVR|nr:hypothetical protein MTR67_050928 [Solanum verrucosum]
MQVTNVEAGHHRTGACFSGSEQSCG